MALACQDMFRRGLLALTILVAAPAAAQQAPVPIVEPGTGWEAEYSVWTGGFEALRVQLDLRTEGSGYRASMRVRTNGAIGSVAPWRAESIAEGLLTRGGRLRSDRYSNTSTWRGEESFTALDWQADGTAQIDFTPARDLPEDISPATAQGTADPLTAVLGGLDRVARQQALCPDNLAVFDGRRRFDVRLGTAPAREVPASKLALYSGPARVCRLGVTPLAGAWRWRNSGAIVPAGRPVSAADKPFTMYFAKPADDLPIVPVRVEGSTIYGNIVGHLVSLRRR